VKATFQCATAGNTDQQQRKMPYLDQDRAFFLADEAGLKAIQALDLFGGLWLSGVIFFYLRIKHF